MRETAVYVRHFNGFSALYDSDGTKLYEDGNRSSVFFFAANNDLRIVTIH